MTKIARPGSEGNMRLLKAYGGGSTPPRQHFATGGAVRSGGNPALDEGLSASGEPARPNLSRPGRKMKGKDKKEAKTNINIVVMGKDKDAAPPAPGPMAAAGPMPPPPMPMPPKPPMGGPPVGPDIGPPMPMRKSGGRVEKHDDAAMDKKMIADAVHKHEEHDHPKEPMTKLAKGGPAKPPAGIDDGAGGGKGRLEKIKAYGK